MIDIQLDGNWMGVQLALSRLPLEVHAAAVWGQRKVSESLVKKVKKHINAQDLNWPQHSSSYSSGDSRILVDTEAYYHTIEAYKEGDNYHAGVKYSKTNAKGALIVEYANMNEYGGGNLPPRPLWRPSIQELGGKTGIRGIVVAAIFAKVQRLRSLGFDVKIGTL